MMVNKAVIIQTAAKLTCLAMIVVMNSNGIAAATIARPRPMSHEIQRISDWCRPRASDGGPWFNGTPVTPVSLTE
jgi:hypothetical protein